MKRLVLALFLTVFAVCVTGGVVYSVAQDRDAPEFRRGEASPAPRVERDRRVEADGFGPPRREHGNRHEQHRPDNPEQIMRQIQHLRQAAENLAHAGRGEMAERLLAESREMEHHLREQHERHRADHPRVEQQLLQEIHGLREEVGDLRRQVNQLKEMLGDFVKQEREQNPVRREENTAPIFLPVDGPFRETNQ